MATVLTLNAGSSSLKFSLYEIDAGCAGRFLLGGQWAGIGHQPSFTANIGGKPYEGAPPQGNPPIDPRIALVSAHKWLVDQGINIDEIAATSHRIVHGGTTFSAPCVIGDQQRVALDLIQRLAPLHVPHGLAVLDEIRAHFPHIPHIACFDTAFHTTQPDAATRLPLPQRFHDKGYRRYGFHGLNYEHIVDTFTDTTARPLPSRLLVFHLGNGCSATAIHNGMSVATTMGFTPLDGLVMGTRTGSIDPGVLLALMRDEGLDHDALEILLYKQSGLLALSELSSDMKTLLASNDKNAKRAVEHFCYWAARHAGSLITAMGGLDAIVFTGGIGENASAVREKIVSHLSWLGATLDQKQNAANATQLSGSNSQLTIWRIPANEELTLARHATNFIS
ncbi:MAG: acetate/propionate family kinase [Hyphomicrobiaceae bacterium]